MAAGRHRNMGTVQRQIHRYTDTLAHAHTRDVSENTTVTHTHTDNSSGLYGKEKGQQQEEGQGKQKIQKSPSEFATELLNNLEKLFNSTPENTHTTR